MTDTTTEFCYDTRAELDADIPAFDPFDFGMSARGRREIAETYGSPIAWCTPDLARSVIGAGHVDAWPPSGLEAVGVPCSRVTWCGDVDRAIERLSVAGDVM
ncbi:MAG: hypothetical protein ACTHU0_14480 [Kofleriaceae bacterium]